MAAGKRIARQGRGRKNLGGIPGLTGSRCPRMGPAPTPSGGTGDTAADFGAVKGRKELNWDAGRPWLCRTELRASGKLNSHTWGRRAPSSEVRGFCGDDARGRSSMVAGGRCRKQLSRPLRFAVRKAAERNLRSAHGEPTACADRRQGDGHRDQRAPFGVWGVVCGFPGAGAAVTCAS